MPASRIPLALLMLLWGGAAFAADPPELARARTLYNAADYDGAIAAAAMARLQPGSADAAALVAARAHLERYRHGAVPKADQNASPGADPGATPSANAGAGPGADAADLAAAREALGTIKVSALTPRDQVDLFIGLGQSLYLAEQFGAAAEMFDMALSKDGVRQAASGPSTKDGVRQVAPGPSTLLTPRDRILLLDWWASALDREAQNRPHDRRAPIFQRIANRMEEELRQDPWSAPANYWFAVASRGAGDVDRAWDAAVAGWVRSSLAPDTAQALRTDLDRLVTQALIPERTRARPAREQPEAAAALIAEWDQVKQQWK